MTDASPVPSGPEAVRIADDGPVRIVTLDRPARRNAVDPATADALRAAFEGFEADPALRVLVLTGAGGVFCAGADLSAVAEGGFTYDPEQPHGPLGPSRMALSKPAIAAVEGHAVAGGLELALMCDLRVASDTAVFGVFCRRWGVPLIDGGTVRLPRLIGQSRAMDMILTGRPVAAQEALSFGLANRVVPAGEALEAAVALARQIAGFPQLCLATDRDSALAQWSLPLAQALAEEGRRGAAPLAQEAANGAARFRDGAGRAGSFKD
ncbi:crotonase/enoyl-CoA hydratase family protein [Rhodovulum sp. DZ06]|uniref:crotonase/enoyl-CoA hydratase family protein n=1 Tax=Rhodovulum sp. DZ06 TaxID=3425126 RepID=UPI003D34EDA0